MTDTTKPLFTLDDTDARRIERLTAKRAALDTEIAMIFKRALRATEPIRVVFGLPQAAEHIVGGHPANAYVVTDSGCGIYDITSNVCAPIPCSQVPEDAFIVQQ